MNTPTLDSPKATTLENNIIDFPEGLPGFPASRQFVMAQKPNERPFAWLQSVSEPNIRFAVVDAYAWDKDFSLEVDDRALEEMGSVDPLDYAVYFILQIQKQEDGTTLKAKPHAPVIVNVRNRVARQVVVPHNSATQKAEDLCLQV